MYTGLVGKKRNIWAAQVRVCGKPCLDLESVLFRRVEINNGDGGVALWVFVRVEHTYKCQRWGPNQNSTLE